MKASWLGLLAAILGCGGGDSTGPSTQNFSGTYQGTVYAILSSTAPVQDRDSLNGGALTLTLARSSGENYDLSISSPVGGVAGGVTVNSAGVIAFPNFDEAEVLDEASSSLLGICNLDNASASPAGSVVGPRATVTVMISGVVCDYSGNGSDVRATHLQLTWTGVK